MNVSNPFERLQQYYFWMSNSEDVPILPNIDGFEDAPVRGMSIAYMQLLTNIPVSTIRMDMVCMMEWLADCLGHENGHIGKNPLTFFEEDEDDVYAELNRQYELDLLFKEYYNSNKLPKDLETLILSGKLDALSFWVAEMNDSEERYPIFLSPEQQIPLEELLGSSVQGRQLLADTTERFMESQSHPEEAVKTTYRSSIKKNARPIIIRKSNSGHIPVYINLNENLNRLHAAISEQRQIRIRYKGKRTEDYQGYILKLMYDYDENMYSLLLLQKKRGRDKSKEEVSNPWMSYLKKNGLTMMILNLTNVLSVDHLEQDSDSNGQSSGETVSKEELILAEQQLLSIAPQVWKNNFHERPVRVKVRFSDSEGIGIFKRVRRDLEERTLGKLTEAGENLYYEDTVYGFKAFRSWLYSYGRAVILMEPEEQRRDIIKRLQKRLEICSAE